MRERAHKKEYVAKQQRWLLFLRHCAKCQAPEGQCTYGDSCTTAKELWRHILTCADPHCQYPRSVHAPATFWKPSSQIFTLWMFSTKTGVPSVTLENARPCIVFAWCLMML